MKYSVRGTRPHPVKRGRQLRVRQASIAAFVVILAFTVSLAMAWYHQQYSSGSSKGVATRPRTDSCGIREPRQNGLNSSTLAQMRKLSEYETVCNAAVTKTVSLFTGIPTTTAEATSQAQAMQADLKEFARFNISPVIFMEPHASNATVVNAAAYGSGAFDAALHAYFMTLKTAGITDAQMGMWVPYPEGNTPVWGNTDPGVFSDIVRRTATIQKQYFPTSKTSVLLESKSYPPGAGESNVVYGSFLPYVNGLPSGLIDSVGVQGFPAGALSAGQSAMTDPKTYIRADFAMEAARVLGARQVWINTGTFSHFAKKGFQPVDLTPEQRHTMLNATLDIAKSIRAAGFQPAIHLFAKDKSASLEKTDWSYWSPGQSASSPATSVFKAFIYDSHADAIPIWLYDY